MENSVKPVRSESLVVNDESEAPSLLDPTTGKLLVTNSVGQRIVELADGNLTVEEIVDALLQEFTGATRDVVLGHAKSFLTEAREKGIVSWT